jgi:FkbM family methyltransferase
MDIRNSLRKLRDQPSFNAAFRYPFLAIRRLGVPISKNIYQHLVYKGSFVVRSQQADPFQMIARGHELENNLYWEGIHGHEPECIQPWLCLAQRSEVVLDIGANTGFFSLMAASVRNRPVVHAFEPVERIAKLLAGNCAANPNLRIEVHQSAIGSYDGTAPIYDPGGDNCYSASLSPVFLDSYKESYEVPIVRIDTFIAWKGIERVDLIKLDVEGCEELALEGMGDTLRAFRPVIFLELLDPPRKSLVDHIMDILKCRYELYQMRRIGIRKTDCVRTAEGTRNIILAPRETQVERILDSNNRRISFAAPESPRS